MPAASATVPAPTATPAPATVQSDIINFVLQDLAIKTGDTVAWTNRDNATHTTTSGNLGAFDGVGWDSGFLSQNQGFSHTFTNAGSFHYTCTVHPFMNGTVTVTE